MPGNMLLHGEWLAGGRHPLLFRSVIYDKLSTADTAGHKIYI